MLTISSLSAKFQSINTNNIIDESMDETKDSFEKLNIDQMNHGFRNDGKQIVPDYKSTAYAKKKQAMNPLPKFGTPDLHLTGSFQSQLNAIVEGEVIKIFSNDEKGPDLENRYKNIYGLGNDFKTQYLDKDLGPTVKKKITDFIGLKF
jgi:hypothetical protein